MTDDRANPQAHKQHPRNVHPTSPVRLCTAPGWSGWRDLGASSPRREAHSSEKARPPPPSPRPPPRPQGPAGPGSIPGTPSPPPESGSSSLRTRSTPPAAAAAPPKVEAQPPWSPLTSRRKLSNCWPRAPTSGSCGRGLGMTPAYRKEPREP